MDLALKSPAAMVGPQLGGKILRINYPFLTLGWHRWELELLAHFTGFFGSLSLRRDVIKTATLKVPYVFCVTEALSPVALRNLFL